MAFLLNLLLFILIFLFLGVVIIAYNVYRSFKNAKRKLKDINRQFNESFSSDTTNDDSSEDIFNHQQSSQPKRKIFSQDEGEYVDFEEE